MKKVITNINQLDFSKYYTYADYLTWQFQERVELFKGQVFIMPPTPNRRHQTISRDILVEMAAFLKDKKCEVFHAPFDVRLPVSLKKGQIDTVVQPDITVVCEEAKLDVQGCNGAPDLVVEILSPGNTKREMKDKFQLFESAKIPEYWVVDPERETIVLYTLNKKGKYIGSRPFMDGDIIKSAAIKGFELDVSPIF